MVLIIRNKIIGIASNLSSVPAPATLQDITDQKLAGPAVTLITADTTHSLVGPTVNQVPIDQLLIKLETTAATCKGRFCASISFNYAVAYSLVNLQHISMRLMNTTYGAKSNPCSPSCRANVANDANAANRNEPAIMMTSHIER